ncbi:MAG: universal stress protein, partial [Gemmatimonadota bacterium]|nr:universal stress protein [Gemmatimonadota bacterium]
MFNRILVPVDGSDTAASAASHAVRLAEFFDSDILGLYVVDV